MKRILVPTNLDEASERALKLATALSEKNNARVYVLRVVKTHGGAYFNKKGEIIEDGALDIQVYVNQKIEETEKLKKWTEAINPEAYQVVRYGGVADVILETMKKYKVGLVIMGNKYPASGQGKNRFFGDLTSYLIGRSTAPILSLKSELMPGQINHIVFANEFDHKLSYFDSLQDIHLFCQSKVELLRINIPKSSDEEEIFENMDYFARINMLKDFGKNIHKSENVEGGILEWISKNPCDLLAVKNITKTGGSPLFKPKLSKKFLRNSKVSTLIYND